MNSQSVLSWATRLVSNRVANTVRIGALAPFRMGSDQGVAVAGIEAQVLEEFLARLSERSEVPDSLVSEVGKVLAADKLPKPDRLAELYSKATGEELL